MNTPEKTTYRNGSNRISFGIAVRELFYGDANGWHLPYPLLFWRDLAASILRPIATGFLVALGVALAFLVLSLVSNRADAVKAHTVSLGNLGLSVPGAQKNAILPHANDVPANAETSVRENGARGTAGSQSLNRIDK